MYYLNRVLKKINRKKFIKKSKKTSGILREAMGNKSIGIVDIGAGHRYLPILLNFDGFSKIAMVDPNDNINWSYRNFKKLLNYPKNVKKYQFGISNNTKKTKYYKTKTSTGSTFVNVYQKSKKKKRLLDQSYFGKKNEIDAQLYSFNDFVKLFFKHKVDVVKIDVEGLELNIIKSIMKKHNPFLIEVETNMNHEIYNNTFNSINNILVKKNYQILTAFPVYKNINNSTNEKPFVYGDYNNPIFRSPLEQIECIYVKKSNTNFLEKIVILIGYGFIFEAKLYLESLKSKLSKKKFLLLKKFIEKFNI